MSWKNILKETPRVIGSGDRQGDAVKAIEQKMNEFGYERSFSGGSGMRFKHKVGAFSNLGPEHDLVLSLETDGISYVSPNHSSATSGISNPNRITDKDVEQLLSNHRVYLRSR